MTDIGCGINIQYEPACTVMRALAFAKIIQGDTEEFGKPPVDSDLGCSVILPGQR